MRVASASRAWLAAILVASASLSCSHEKPVEAPRREVSAHWQDVFDTTPELLAIIRPQAIKSDPVYGGFFKSLLRVAQAKSEMGGVHAIEAAEQCEEIIVGVTRHERDGDGPDDVVLILRGVPASLDPAKLADANGTPLCHVVDDRARVPELECFDRKAGPDSRGAIFVLPDRTWVAALGPARARARQAFATPFGRPTPKADEGALAMLRLDADAFVKTRRLEENQVLGPLTKKLRAVILTLGPGTEKEGLAVTLLYTDDDASAWAEMRVKQLFGELSEKAPQRFGWLKDAKVDHEGSKVTTHVAIPPRLLEELPTARADSF